MGDWTDYAEAAVYTEQAPIRDFPTSGIFTEQDAADLDALALLASGLHTL